jgi:hypothetical protein
LTFFISSSAFMFFTAYIILLQRQTSIILHKIRNYLSVHFSNIYHIKSISNNDVKSWWQNISCHVTVFSIINGFWENRQNLFWACCNISIALDG